MRAYTFSCVILGLALHALPAKAGDLYVEVTGLEGSEGAVNAILYDSKDGFGQPFHAIARVQAKPRDGKMRFALGGLPAGKTFQPPPTIRTGETLGSAVVPEGGALTNEQTADYMKVMQLVLAYQSRGHCIAELDPLNMYAADLNHEMPPDLELANYGFTEADLDRAAEALARPAG